jgi:hypothetical protein
MAHCIEDLDDLNYDPGTPQSRAYYWICRVVA